MSNSSPHGLISLIAQLILRVPFLSISAGFLLFIVGLISIFAQFSNIELGGQEEAGFLFFAIVFYLLAMLLFRIHRLKCKGMLLKILNIGYVAALVVSLIFNFGFSNEYHYQRAHSYLENRNFDGAVYIFEQLDDYKDSQAMIEECKRAEEADRMEQDYWQAWAYLERKEYTNAVRAFGRLGDYKDSAAQAIASQEKWDEAKYADGVQLMQNGKYQEAINKFKQIPAYKDSQDQMIACQTAIMEQKYAAATELMQAEEYDKAISQFETIKDFKDSEDKISQCTALKLEKQYADATAAMQAGDFQQAMKLFHELDNYKDAHQLYFQCKTGDQQIYYTNAKQLMEEENYLAAIPLFEKASTFKDSRAQLNQCKAILYEQAESYIAQGDYSATLAAYRALGTYKNVNQLLKTNTQLITAQLKECKRGDIITFGVYPKNDTAGIDWLVLSVSADQVLLISQQILDVRPFHEGTKAADEVISWETCSLRAWLNDTFYNTAFSSELKNLIQLSTVNNSLYSNNDISTYFNNTHDVIHLTSKRGQLEAMSGNTTQDHLFLLSEKEVDTYLGGNLSWLGLAGTNKKGDDAAQRVATARTTSIASVYAKLNSLSIAAQRNKDGWWLRSANVDHVARSVVNAHGGISYSRDEAAYYGVRPAMWVKLNEALSSPDAQQSVPEGIPAAP